MKKRILMVFLPLICMIGGVTANCNYEPIRKQSLNSYSRVSFSNEVVASHKYLKKNENNSFSLGSRNIDSDRSSLMRSGSIDGDPLGPGVGESVAILDGLLILLFLACLYILWKPLVRCCQQSCYRW